jgi:integrase
MVVSSQKTKEVYARYLRWLQSELNGGRDGLDFLKNIETVVEHIENTDYSDNSKKLIYSTIVSTLRDREAFADVLPVYQAVMTEYAQQVFERAKEQKATEAQEEAYLPWKDILAAVDKHFESMDDLAGLQDYLILSLYTLNAPVRLDYAGMKVAKKGEEPKEGNVCVMGPRSGEFIFREFKTANKMGEQRIKIAPKLFKIINEWLKLSPDPSVLLLNKNGSPMVENTLGKRITELFEGLTGKKISVNALRHSYATHYHKGSKSIKKKEADAAKMLHTAPRNEEYAFKK